MIINQVTYTDRINNYNNSGIFGFGGDYTQLLGLSIENLGNFPKNPTIENIDQFITFINRRFGINMPTRGEYSNVKSGESSDVDFDKLQRKMIKK